MFPQSLKILSSLNYSSHPSPTQILHMIAIFKDILIKEISEGNNNSSKVKMQDGAN